MRCPFKESLANVDSFTFVSCSLFFAERRQTQKKGRDKERRKLKYERNYSRSYHTVYSSEKEKRGNLDRAHQWRHMTSLQVKACPVAYARPYLFAEALLKKLDVARRVHHEATAFKLLVIGVAFKKRFAVKVITPACKSFTQLPHTLLLQL